MTMVSYFMTLLFLNAERAIPSSSNAWSMKWGLGDARIRWG